MNFDELPSPIKTQRYKQRLTQYELGKLIGTSQAYVWRLEKGYCVPSPVLLKKLSLVLRCKQADLLPKEETTNAG